ncbi:MAG TPA: CoA transferase [Usitatibacter sp.]|nr:CoA transferase [Usitatibacter sp.]
MNAPLHGIRVVDLSWLLPGPFCTNLLADLGADVIKVERPGDGDYARDLLPGLFQLVNRGKRSVVFDLRLDGDRERLLALADTADVFVEGFRPGVVDRLGVGYGEVSRRNPRIVYVSISGYGQSGPMASHGGHDINFCAQAGLLAIPSSVGQERPYRMQLPVSDIAGGMYAALSTLAALRQRDATGRGAHLDIALADCALAWGALRWADGPRSPRDGWRHVMPGNDLFRAADGVWLAAALVEAKFLAAFGDAVRELDGQGTGADRPSPTAREAIVEAFARHPSAAWIDAARRHDLPITVVAADYAQIARDPLFVERGLWGMGEDGERPMPAYPVKLPGLRRGRRAPQLGAHTTQAAEHPAAAWES